MTVIPFQQTPKPVVNPFVRAYDPNATLPQTPQPSTPQASTGGQTIPNSTMMATTSQAATAQTAIPNASTGGSNVPATSNSVYGMQTAQMANPSNSVAVPNIQRWNVDAPAAERIAHMKDPNNIADARNELLASKSIYGQKSGAGDLSGAWGAHTWADEVRAAAGISNDDPLYGNAATPQGDADVTKPATPAAGGGGYKSPWTIDPAQAAQAAKEQAAAKFRQMLDAGKNAWQTGIVGAKNAFDYTNKVNADNRVLRNEQFKENNNPFSGQFVYDKTNMLRNDNLQDTASNADYNNKVNSLNQTWADLQSAEPGQEQALYDQLYQQAAALGIQADQLNLQGNQQAFNQFDANRKFDYGVSQDAVKNGQWDKTFNYNAVQDALKNGMSQQQIDNQAKQFAQTLGYNYDNMNANDKQAWAQIAISQQNANTSSANAKTTAANSKNSQAARDIESEVYGHAQDFQSTQDVNDYFNANSGYLAKNLGAAQVEALKKSFMTPFNADTKQTNSDYYKALGLAQKDMRWIQPDADRKALIKEYQDLLQ